MARNVLDSAIQTVSPTWALKRAKSRQGLEIMNSGYSHHGASYHKKSLRWFFGNSSKPKHDINDNQDTLNQRSRSLFMGAPIARSAMLTMRTNVVGCGLTLKPNIDYEYLGMSEEDAEKWIEDVNREWNHFISKSHCDIMGLNTFDELQQLAFLSQLMNGDSFALLTTRKDKGARYDLKIHLVEADNIDTPLGYEWDKNIQKGVELHNNKVVAYYINTNSDDDFSVPEYVKVPAYGKNTGMKQVLHLMNCERIGQTRGVPLVAPIVEALKQIERYTNAELTAAVVSGYFTGFVKQNSAQGQIGEDDGWGDDDEEFYQQELSLGNGNIAYLDKDQDITFANPGRPNPNFEGFVDAVTRQIGAALEIPYELLVKRFDSSYSASRGALLEAWKMFKMHRKWFESDFCQPVYERWLYEAVAKGYISAPGFFDNPIVRDAYCKASWYGDTNGQLDPLKEAKAAAGRIALGVSTREREAQELTGTDFKDNAKKLSKEQQLMNEIQGLEKQKIT